MDEGSASAASSVRTHARTRTCIAAPTRATTHLEAVHARPAAVLPVDDAHELDGAHAAKVDLQPAALRVRVLREEGRLQGRRNERGRQASPVRAYIHRRRHPRMRTRIRQQLTQLLWLKVESTPSKALLQG